MKTNKKRIFAIVAALVVLLSFCISTVPALAADATTSSSAVDETVEKAYGEIKSQVLNIINNVVLNILGICCAVAIVVSITLLALQRHKQEQMNYVPLIISIVVFITLFVLPKALFALL